MVKLALHNIKLKTNHKATPTVYISHRFLRNVSFKASHSLARIKLPYMDYYLSKTFVVSLFTVYVMISPNLMCDVRSTLRRVFLMFLHLSFMFVAIKKFICLSYLSNKSYKLHSRVNNSWTLKECLMQVSKFFSRELVESFTP